MVPSTTALQPISRMQADAMPEAGIANDQDIMSSRISPLALAKDFQPVARRRPPSAVLDYWDVGAELRSCCKTIVASLPRQRVRQGPEEPTQTGAMLSSSWGCPVEKSCWSAPYMLRNPLRFGPPDHGCVEMVARPFVPAAIHRQDP
jgi:hypothetical protein